jgi:hypothetical protein
MNDIAIDGTSSSAGLLNTQFIALQSQGQTALNNLNSTNLEALLEIQRGLARLNGYRCRANRVLAPGLSAAFYVSDLLDTNQAATTATMRADAQSATLAERKAPGQVSVASTTFSTNVGSVEQFGDLYRVSTTDGSAPVGTFTITLNEPYSISLLVIDIAPTPSLPNIAVSVSADNLVYNQAISSSFSGYRVNVHIVPQEVRYIQIVFSPTHPDTLGGSSYTFGITDFSALAVQYQLESEWYSVPITFNPTSANVMFLATGGANIEYYLSFDGQIWQGVTPGQVIPVPGATTNSTTMPLLLTLGGEANTNGQLDGILPSDIYFPSLQVSLNGTELPIVLGLPLGTRATNNEYIIVQELSVAGTIGYALYLLPCTTYNFGQVFNVSYDAGPAEMTAYLRVQMNTEDKAITPSFSGASLESV